MRLTPQREKKLRDLWQESIRHGLHPTAGMMRELLEEIDALRKDLQHLQASQALKEEEAKKELLPQF